jgi:dihydrolipoamide dehydrogenase
MAESPTPFDLVVIGSGSGGYVAAIRAAQLGFRTACVEKYPALGGTCLNVGCIPSKALLDSSELFALATHRFAAHGIRASVELDLPAMMKRKDDVVRGLTGGVASLFRKHGITRLTGTGRIAGANAVDVTHEGRTERHATKRILIATGSKPAALPGIAFDGRRIVHSTDALALPSVPKRLAVIGAGAIGLELGSVWRRLGAEVEVFEFLDSVVPGSDRASVHTLHRALVKQGMRFTFGAAAESAAIDGDDVRVMLRVGDERRETRCDVLLVAAGRRPFTDGLGAAEAGVEIDPRGRVVVNDALETRVPGIWAVGDVIRGPMLAHKAEEEGIAAAERMAGLPGHVNYDAIPNVVYTWPEFASVGLSQEQAKEQGIEVAVGSFPFLANGRARAMDERDGQVTLVADARTDRLLGAHIVGPRASDLIAEPVLAIEMGASAEDLARTVHAHPTLPEAVREAALAVAKRPIHI